MNREINVEMHPFMKYPGGKTKEIPLVLNNLPKTIVRYIEPFVGGGSIYYAMNITNSLINDKSFDLSLLFKLVKEQNLKLKNYLISFATAYNKFGEGQAWHQANVERMFSKDELLIGRDYWDFVCNDKDGFKIIFDQYKKSSIHIKDAITRIKTVYNI